MKEKEKDDAYPFARFNKKVDLVKYTDEEYERVVKPLSKDWSKEETDHLWRLCEEFDLRFIVIADRYDLDFAGEKKREKKAKAKKQKLRTVDELKERYYSVSKAILEYRG